ncbi:hypothetical protein GCM10023184_30960 [Flaviaesturariibacter amylovorans]|uniref:Uncharacterized protein n=1 Tax=Flaviaesturariibacter amylovorans TaxID=1084520 RepID=A0ABP8H8M6_9BACT
MRQGIPGETKQQEQQYEEPGAHRDRFTNIPAPAGRGIIKEEPQRSEDGLHRRMTERYEKKRGGGSGGHFMETDQNSIPCV